jgi:hypothetical protein
MATEVLDEPVGLPSIRIALFGPWPDRSRCFILRDSRVSLSARAKIPASSMRRFSAISLVLFMMLPVLLPLTALGQDEDANLPACCRRHEGKDHHCAMMTAYLAWRLPGTKLMATPVPCPDFPSTAPVSVHFHLGLSSALAHFAEISSHPAIHVQTEARARIALDRAWRKRGPPEALHS